jgi:hypothetical protein
METIHKEYSILVLEIDAEPKKWRAHIRRRDGAKIKVVANDRICPEAIMPDEFSAEKALEQAKRSINAGAFLKASDEDQDSQSPDSSAE